VHDIHYERTVRGYPKISIDYFSEHIASVEEKNKYRAYYYEVVSKMFNTSELAIIFDTAKKMNISLEEMFFNSKKPRFDINYYLYESFNKTTTKCLKKRYLEQQTKLTEKVKNALCEFDFYDEESDSDLLKKKKTEIIVQYNVLRKYLCLLRDYESLKLETMRFFNIKTNRKCNFVFPNKKSIESFGYIKFDGEYNFDKLYDSELYNCGNYYEEDGIREAFVDNDVFNLLDNDIPKTITFKE
jgi:hypothetical protein